MPPIYFAQRRDWSSFALNGFLYGLGLTGIMAAALGGLWFLTLALLFWLLCVAHMADTRRREKAAARAIARPDRRLPIWAKLVKLALFLGSLIAIMVLLETVTAQHGRPVGPNALPLFPVMVVTPGRQGTEYDAHLIFHKDLAEFLRKNPGSTFLVPSGHEKRLRARLTEGNFTVTQGADGRQTFEVWRPVHDEAYAIGWYEAAEKELFPRRLSLFHHMLRGFFFIPALFGSLLVNWIGDKLLRRLARRWPTERETARRDFG